MPSYPIIIRLCALVLYIEAHPSTPKICPDIYAALSEAKNAHALAMSSGVPRRPKAIRLIRSSIFSPLASYSSAKRSVLTMPGATALTRMPCGANSLAADLVREMTAPFVAEYATCPGEPNTAVTDAILTMLPPPQRAIRRLTNCINSNTAITFTKNIRSVSSRIIIPIFRLYTIPALLTRQSICPSALKICISAVFTAVALVISNSMGRICGLSVVKACLSQAYTIAPSAANCSAICLPIPCAAPVMIHTLFSNRCAIRIILRNVLHQWLNLYLLPN